MKDERIIDLVNGELDGINTPSEKTELVTLLEEDPSLTAYFDEMQKLDQLLAAVPMVDPPASLKSRVMNAISHQEAPVRTATRVSWLDRVMAPFTRRPAVAVAYAFAIGMIAGVAILSVVESAGPDSGTVQGTIVRVDPPALAKTDISAGTAAAGIVVTRLNDELRVDVQMQTSDVATLSIASGGRDPIVIDSAPGTPEYSLVLPSASTIHVILTSGAVSESTDLAIEGDASR